MFSRYDTTAVCDRQMLVSLLQHSPREKRLSKGQTDQRRIRHSVSWWEGVRLLCANVSAVVVSGDAARSTAARWAETDAGTTPLWGRQVARRAAHLNSDRSHTREMASLVLSSSSSSSSSPSSWTRVDSAFYWLRMVKSVGYPGFFIWGFDTEGGQSFVSKVE